MLGILLAIHIVVCVALIGVVLLQRSEGGWLGTGGGAGGFMTARGTGDLLTRATWILGSIFFVLSMGLTLLAGVQRGGGSVVDRLKVDAVDPSTLNRPLPTAPAPVPSGPQPLQAPTPQVRNPFLDSAPPVTAPANPDPAPTRP